MAEKITLQIMRDRDYLVDDWIEIEINSVVQPDRVRVWGQSRVNQGYGKNGMLQCGYGFGAGLPYGLGVYGFGYYGQGADVLAHKTMNEFVAGDYTVRARCVDGAGNVGSWSELETVEHRPDPPAPESLEFTNNTLAWTWSDS